MHRDGFDTQRSERIAVGIFELNLPPARVDYDDAGNRSKMNPFLGRNVEALDPLEWLARMSDYIPDPGQHRTPFYEYANRVRGERQLREPDTRPATAGRPASAPRQAGHA